MKLAIHILGLVLAVALVGCGRSKAIVAGQISPQEWEQRLQASGLGKGEFAQLYAQALAEKFNPAKVRIVDEGELEVVFANGAKASAFLDNVWAEVSADPTNRVDICDRYIRAFDSSFGPSQEKPWPPDTNSIVAVIRDAEFLRQFESASGRFDKSGATTNRLVVEKLASDLNVVYASDSEGAISYLTEGARMALDLDFASLRRISMTNLKRILPDVRTAGAGPIFMIAADGNYESSLLLADTLWDNLASHVEGEIVAAVPSRDMLVYTGSKSSEGIAQLGQIVRKVHQGGDHLISQTLLIRRDGKWVEFKP